jgi:GR25 family glycosyltransferase involved in LPS biosynthesis
MTFSDHFDQAFCINLDSRVDRWKASQKEFNKIGLVDVERISAVNGFEEPAASIRPGEVGCLKSHLKVFEIAKDRGLKSFLILEDDVEFSDDFNDRFNSIEENLPTYDILYMGVNPHTGSSNEVAPNIFRVMNTYAAHCVIFKESCHDDIINRLSGPLMYPVDVQYGQEQIRHKAYSIKPPIAWQRKSFSDINQQIVDYHFLRG